MKKRFASLTFITLALATGMLLSACAADPNEKGSREKQYAAGIDAAEDTPSTVTSAGMTGASNATQRTDATDTASDVPPYRLATAEDGLPEGTVIWNPHGIREGEGYEIIEQYSFETKESRYYMIPAEDTPAEREAKHQEWIKQNPPYYSSSADWKYLRDEELLTDEEGTYFVFDEVGELPVGTKSLKCNASKFPKDSFYVCRYRGMEKLVDGEWVRLENTKIRRYIPEVFSMVKHDGYYVYDLEANWWQYMRSKDGEWKEFSLGGSLEVFEPAPVEPGEYRMLLYICTDGQNFVYYVPFTLK